MARVLVVFGALLDITVSGASSFLEAGELYFVALAGLVPLLMIPLVRITADAVQLEDVVAWENQPAASRVTAERRDI